MCRPTTPGGPTGRNNLGEMGLAQAELPEGLATEQARWLLTRLEAGGDGLTLDELAPRCAPLAREDVGGPDAFLETLRRAAPAVGAGALTGAEAHRNALTLGVRAADGAEHRLIVVVQPSEPHLIASLAFRPAPEGRRYDWEAIAREGVGESTASHLPADLVRRLDETLARVRAEGRMVGLLGALVSRGEIVWFRGLGLADIDARAPMTDRTVIRIGSVTKPMTAVGVMQLRDRGLVDLERPASEYLRALRIDTEAGDPPTVRHLLTHSGAIADPGAVSRVAEGGAIPTVAELFGGRLRSRGAGRRWAYSNAGFTALGQLVEDAAGRPFAEQMRSALFDPLGMSSTDYERTPRLGGPVTRPYAVDLGRTLGVPFTEVGLTGAGSVYSTARDMARFIGLVTGERQEVLDAATLREMTSPQADIGPGGPPGMTMGFGFVIKDGSPRMVWHNGGWDGASTAMWTAPEHGLGVLLYANTLPHLGNLDATASELLEAACEALPERCAS